MVQFHQARALILEVMMCTTKTYELRTSAACSRTPTKRECSTLKTRCWAILVHSTTLASKASTTRAKADITKTLDPKKVA